MKLGAKQKIFDNLSETNLNENNSNIETGNFGTRICEFINPCVDGNFVPLLFELRGNYEIVAVGSIEAILDFFKLSIAGENENGYDLGIEQEGEEELKRNPKSPKYFANVCNYDKKLIAKLKKDYFNLSKDENLYFYRSTIQLLNEEQTVEVLKQKLHYKNFDSFAIHTIRRQCKFHKIFNLPYNLNINVTLVEDLPEYKEQTSLSFKIEDDNSISLSGTYDHVSNFSGKDSVNVALNIQNYNTSDNLNDKTALDNKWSFKSLLSTTLKNNRPISLFAQ